MDFDLLSALAKEVTQLLRYGGGKTPITAEITSSGDTTVHTPSDPSKSIKLFWCTAINRNPSANPAITIKIGSLELYKVVAVSHWEIFQGAPGDSLIVNLSEGATVDFTAHILEV